MYQELRTIGQYLVAWTGPKLSPLKIYLYDIIHPWQHFLELPTVFEMGFLHLVAPPGVQDVQEDHLRVLGGHLGGWGGPFGRVERILSVWEDGEDYLREWRGPFVNVGRTIWEGGKDHLGRWRGPFGRVGRTVWEGGSTIWEGGEDCLGEWRGPFVNVGRTIWEGGEDRLRVLGGPSVRMGRTVSRDYEHCGAMDSRSMGMSKKGSSKQTGSIWRATKPDKYRRR
ncbi:uncharacterized protein F5891DRAFT_978762 [Suillus fuscotomentosus]|uniref:Uncharacterized protein n=1 Tax=Suillus fuscotomentosus TaxID=1912939 RepID=A0AAD4ECH9_9AGAM|nr:uncharacterized protein F5891DRAFT_978762 [Suillus fuscotomentosus]KAG1902464.1 hypothetical protein F5891DRAFT_978762 [Suillus fuscotomentosus]